MPLSNLDLTTAAVSGILGGPIGIAIKALWGKWSNRKKERIDLATGSVEVGDKVLRQAYELAKAEKSRADDAEMRIRQLSTQHVEELERRDNEIERLLGEIERVTEELDRAQAAVDAVTVVLDKTRAELNQYREVLQKITAANRT